jgi:tellurite resistance protein TerC
VIAVLFADLRLFHAKEHEPTVKESATWVAVWVSLALLFGLGIYLWAGGRLAGEYFAGYLIEYSLSVDNMFVFVVIFGYFNVPRAFQHQVLFYGILGAIVFRGIFIAIGVILLERFEWVIYIFGAFLIYTAWRIARGLTEDIHPEDNPVLKWAQKRFRTTTRFDGQKLFTMENAKRVATPLFIVLLFIETTDIVFALDSIPAIFGVTREPFIVLTSNVFAILGLRALYFLLAGGMDRLHLLKFGLAIILAFVGAKMIAEAIPCSGHGMFCEEGSFHMPIWLSLAVIIGVLAATAVLSFMLPTSTQERIEREIEEHLPHHEDDPDDGVGPSAGGSEDSQTGSDPRGSPRPR